MISLKVPLTFQAGLQVVEPLYVADLRLDLAYTAALLRSAGDQLARLDLLVMGIWDRGSQES